MEMDKIEEQNEEAQEAEKEVEKEVETVKEKEKQYIPILPGETLDTIAKKYETTVDKIIEDNKLNPDYIHPNQWIFV